MTVHRVAENRVAADEPGPDDVFVRVAWTGPSDDGRHRLPFHGPLLPIERYDEAVVWAREMARHMTHPLYVVPMTAAQALNTAEARRGAAALTGAERGELRRVCVNAMAEVLRDSPDPAVRAGAYDVLRQAGVVRP